MQTEKRKHGCLSRIAFAILVVITAFLLYNWISKLGSARIEIENLEVLQKKGKKGDLLEGTILVKLKLINKGSQDGKFCLDLQDYKEYQNIEKHPSLWSFKTEFYYPEQSKWEEYPNKNLWNGTKISASVLEINIEKKGILNLEAYLKNTRGWRIKLPENMPDMPEDSELFPSKIRISIISPSNKTTSMAVIDL